MNELLNLFLSSGKTGSISERYNAGYIYNEFSLQFELGHFLRTAGHDVFYEKNVCNEFQIPDKSASIFKTSKKEIDLIVKSASCKAAIELKYLNNGKHPEAMYDIISDLNVLGIIKSKDKSYKCYQLTVTTDINFTSLYPKKSAPKTDFSVKLYNAFRHSHPLNGIYHKPTGDKKGELSLDISNIQFTSPTIVWNKVDNLPLYYTLTEIE